MSTSAWFSDPLAEVIALLQPRMAYSRTIEGAGRWAVRYSAFGLPSFCAVLDGGCRLAVQGQAAIELRQGDFVLLPATPGFVMSSLEEGATPVDLNAQQIAAQAVRLDGGAAESRSPDEVLRHGDPEGPTELRVLGGYFELGSPDAALLVSLLPALLHLQGVPRLSRLVGQVGEETRTRRAGRGLVMARLVELMLIEALRSAAEAGGGTGIVARPVRRAPGPGPACDACSAWPALDGGATRRRGGAVAICLLRALQAGPGPAPDGVPAGLAHGFGQGSVASSIAVHPASRRAGGLWICKHLQHGLQSGRGGGAGAVRQDLGAQSLSGGSC